MAAATDRARQRAEARRRELAERQRREARRRLLLRVLLPVALVVVVVAVFVVVRVTTGGGGSDAAPGVLASGPAPASVVQAVTTIPASTFDRVGAGDTKAVRAPAALPEPVTFSQDGKPEILYVGGEFCPYCAMERWVMVTALSRFGTFSDLQQTNSSGTDVHPNTATLSFHGASYSSDYVSFAPYETLDRDGQPLDTLPSQYQSTYQTYDPQGSIPFQFLGGKYAQVGPAFNTDAFADLTHEQVAEDVADPTTAVGALVIAAANQYTARVCELTGGQPGDVCQSSGVQAAAKAIGS